MPAAGAAVTTAAGTVRRPRGSRLRALLPLVLVCLLVAGVLGGLLRAGVVLPTPLADHAAQAMLHHGALMLCALMGTAIAMERAVALGRRWGYLAPLASLLSGVLLVAGQQRPAALASLSAASVFALVSWRVVQRQPAAHTRLLLVAALCWWIGDLLWLASAATAQVLPWWFAFLVVTVAAERLEMTRLMRRPPWVQHSLMGALGVLGSGALATLLDARTGGTLFGLALMLLAAWLFRFDIARRTVRAGGLGAYMAWCLLLGYGWLALAGLAWLGSAWGCPGRDLYLHALGLGFIASMVLGHAPVILPAVSGLDIRFHRGFYAPLILLHLSLAVRLFGGLERLEWRTRGAMLNALALALFLATVVRAARRR